VKRHRLFMAAVTSAMLLAAPASAATPPDTWDGLVKVKAKRLDIAYLQPGADFRGYTKVMLDPTEVAFHKNWRRSQNSTDRGLSGTISDRDVQEAITKGVAASNDIFAAAWTKAGYPVVTEPGPDVLRIKTGIVNIWVSAPEKSSASRSHTFAPEAGEATFFVEARDSMTGALLGRAVDQRFAGDTSHNWRTSVSNRADFRELVENWASDGVRGINELKSVSPIRP
jgi:uncharacterized protein DUF3313